MKVASIWFFRKNSEEEKNPNYLSLLPAPLLDLAVPYEVSKYFPRTTGHSFTFLSLKNETQTCREACM